MNHNTSPIDKSTWGDGPWQTEPDRAEWTHAGLPCLAIRNEWTGSWCGYAAVPPGHRFHGRHYGDVDVEVHGDLTYANGCDGERICHVPKPGEPDDVWWLGFDCGHAFDLMPGYGARMRTLGMPDLPEPFTPTYCTLEYVTEQTNALADQLAAVQS